MRCLLFCLTLAWPACMLAAAAGAPPPAGSAPAAKPPAPKAFAATELKDYLERWGVRNYHYDDRAESFFFGLRIEGREYVFQVGTFGEAAERFLMVAARSIARVQPAEPDALAFFKTLAVLNYSLVMGRVGWDEQSGEVSCEYVIPLKGKPEYEVFASVLTGVLSAAEETAKQIGRFMKPPVAPKPEAVEKPAPPPEAPPAANKDAIEQPPAPAARPEQPAAPQ